MCRQRMPISDCSFGRSDKDLLCQVTNSAVTQNILFLWMCQLMWVFAICMWRKDRFPIIILLISWNLVYSRCLFVIKHADIIKRPINSTKSTNLIIHRLVYSLHPIKGTLCKSKERRSTLGTASHSLIRAEDFAGRICSNRWPSLS